MDCSTPGLPVHHQLLEFIQTHVHRVGDAIQPSHPLSFCSPTFNLSQHQGLFNESVLCIKRPKYWGFSFSISPSNEYSGLISFRIDWFYLLAFQGALKSLLQHCSSKASILWCSAFFIVQLSHPYMTTGLHSFEYMKLLSAKWCLCFKYAVKVCHSFPSKEQASFHFMAPVTIHSDFGAQDNKVCHCFHCFPIYLPIHGRTVQKRSRPR